MIEQPDGRVQRHCREFGGFGRDCRLLAAWLAELARLGLVRASNIPPTDLRELRLVWRYRRKLSSMCASEINRLHKILILCECANAARMTKSALASKYRSLMVRKSHKKAIVAVAHKMISLIFLMLSRRQPYIDQAIDCAAMSAKKNAPRWIKQLKTIGRWPASKTAAASH